MSSGDENPTNLRDMLRSFTGRVGSSLMLRRIDYRLNPGSLLVRPLPVARATKLDFAAGVPAVVAVVLGLEVADLAAHTTCPTAGPIVITTHRRFRNLMVASTSC